MSSAGLPRHIQIRRHYDKNRYMRRLTQDELNVRIRDVFLNMLRLTPDGKIGVPPIDDAFAIWNEKWTHVLEEMQLRHGPYPGGFTRDILHREPFPDLVSELARKAARILSAKRLARGQVFIKFGQRKYMEALHGFGQLRIQPASLFANKAFSPAVQDDELKMNFSLLLAREQILKVVKNPQDVPANVPDQRVDVQFRSPTDYWLYCVTNSVEPRLFADFNADSCVIIRDQKAFRDRLADAAITKLTDAMLREGDAAYIDPLLPNDANVFVPLAKHFGYSYQDEHRFCWLPQKATMKLEHVDLDLGDLSGISELITL